MLRKILFRHPAIVIPPEAYGLVNAIKKFVRYRGLDWKDMVNLIFGEFYSWKSFEYWETDIFEEMRNLYDCPKTERSLAFLIDQIYRTYLKQHKPEATIWGDKTPYNTLRLKWIDRVFPRAQYIHLLRDGRDVVASYMKSGLILNLDDACVRWLQSVAAARKLEKRVGMDRILTVKYEDLVQDAGNLVPIICQFLNIEFSPTMLENSKVHLGDDFLSHLQNVKHPMNTQSIGKWKKDLTAEQQIRMLKLIKRRLLQVGYNVDDGKGVAIS